jgi:hypothetical protein
VPPGIADAVTPNPLFSLAPSATVDEGNNWINVSWGPLSLTNPATLPTGGNYGAGTALANYNLTQAIDNIPTSQNHPSTDFFGNPRPDSGSTAGFDPGAVEFGGSPPVASQAWSPSSYTFPNNIGLGTTPTGPSQVFTLTSTGNGTITITSSATTGSSANFVITANTCTSAMHPTLTTGQTCTVTVAFRSTGSDTAGTKTGSLTITDSAGTATVSLSGTVVTSLAFAGPTPSLVTGTTTAHTGTVTISNAGTATFTFNALPTVTKLTGPGAASFSITAGGTCTASTALAAGGNCTLAVTYSPGGSTNTSTARVNVTGTGGPSPQSSATFSAN